MSSPDIDHHPIGRGKQTDLQLQIQHFKEALKTGSNAITSTITNKFHVIEYEPSYPQQTRIHNFPTRASQKEMAKHDRYIIHGMLYSEMLKENYLQHHWSIPDTSRNAGPWRFPRKLCITITMKNRTVPYIHSLLMTLMKSHSDGGGEGANDSGTADVLHLSETVKAGHRLLSYAELHLLDTERSGENLYDEKYDNIYRLPFLQHHKVRDTVKIWNGQNNRLLKIQNILASARICAKSGLDWCLMLEEFTVVPLNFLESLQRFIIAPLESFIDTHRSESGSGMLSDGEVIRKKMSVVSLFSAYDSEAEELIKIHDVDYSRKKYERDRAKLNSERRALGLEEHHYEYEMYPIFSTGAASIGGSDAAMLFHSSMVKRDLIPMLTKLSNIEEKKLWGDWALKGFSINGSNGSIERSEQDDHNYGNDFDLEREFSLYTGVKRYRVEPSLVNRIGFYDEDFNTGTRSHTPREERDLGITNWLTDPRFLFEAGRYVEGSSEYCESSSGEWIWDGLWNKHGRSCCDDKEEKSKECEEW